MNNSEIAQKLSWVRSSIHKVQEAKKAARIDDPHITYLHAAVNAFNSVKEALEGTLKREPFWMLLADWRDALEIQLLYAESQIRIAAEKLNVTLD